MLRENETIKKGNLRLIKPEKQFTKDIPDHAIKDLEDLVLRVKQIAKLIDLEDRYYDQISLEIHYYKPAGDENGITRWVPERVLATITVDSPITFTYDVKLRRFLIGIKNFGSDGFSIGEAASIFFQQTIISRTHHGFVRDDND